MPRLTSATAWFVTLGAIVCCGAQRDDSSIRGAADVISPVASTAPTATNPPTSNSASSEGNVRVDPTHCPPGTAAATMNGLAVCKTASGVPLFDHVFLVVLENMSLNTFGEGTTPNLDALRAGNAIATDYHGVSHPSLPNYIALTSGDTQGIACDCRASAATVCTSSCSLLAENCACTRGVRNLADQIEDAKKTWMAYGEGMGSPCNLDDLQSAKYAVRHVPFLYYDNVQKDAGRCRSHVVDLLPGGIALGSDAPAFQFVAPNLVHDGHDPQAPGFHATNLANIDAFIGPLANAITTSDAYKNGGLFVIVFDEDDNSGFPTADDPIPLLVLSPYAKKKFQSVKKANHYSLLATIEDGLALEGRLGKAAAADALGDFFPNQ